MTNEQDIINRIEAAYPDAVCKKKQERRVEACLPPDRLFDFAGRMQSHWNFPHLSAISCVDWINEGEFELVYHFWSYEEKILVSAKIRIPREEARFISITELWQPAKFFERDIHEMFGVVFEGNDDLEKYILTEWEGPPPMRKDFVTRDFANRFYHFKEYEAEWMGPQQNPQAADVQGGSNE